MDPLPVSPRQLDQFLFDHFVVMMKVTVPQTPNRNKEASFRELFRLSGLLLYPSMLGRILCDHLKRSPWLNSRVVWVKKMFPLVAERARLRVHSLPLVEHEKSLWILIHHFASVSHSGNQFRDFMNSLLKLMPREEGRLLAQAFMRAEPIPKDPEEHFEWAWELHNHVNKTLHKPEITLEEAEELFNHQLTRYRTRVGRGLKENHTRTNADYAKLLQRELMQRAAIAAFIRRSQRETGGSGSFR